MEIVLKFPPFWVSPRLTAISPPTRALDGAFDVIVPLKIQSFTVTAPPITSAARPPILALSVLRSSVRLALVSQVQF